MARNRRRKYKAKRRRKITKSSSIIPYAKNRTIVSVQPSSSKDQRQRTSRKSANRSIFVNSAKSRRGKRHSLQFQAMPNNLCQQLQTSIKTLDIQTPQSRVLHVWQRHGCENNAEKSAFIRGGKLLKPSHFLTPGHLVRAISSTIDRPNWSRGDPPVHLGFNTGGISRFRGGKKKFNSRHRKAHRTLFFKEFLNPVGRSGEGYGIDADSDRRLCYMCCLVLENHNKCIITAFPILTRDALNKGQGEKVTHNQQISNIEDSSASEVTKSSMNDTESRKSLQTINESERQSTNENDISKN